jgi:hypothetical protein
MMRGKLRIDAGIDTEGGAAMAAEIAGTVKELAGEVPVGGVILAVDVRVEGMDWDSVFEGIQVTRVPSWESAFRALRDKTSIGEMPLFQVD